MSAFVCLTSLYSNSASGRGLIEFHCFTKGQSPRGHGETQGTANGTQKAAFILIFHAQGFVPCVSGPMGSLPHHRSLDSSRMTGGSCTPLCNIVKAPEVEAGLDLEGTRSRTKTAGFPTLGHSVK